MDYSLKLKLKDKDILNVSIIHLNNYRVEINGKFVHFFTKDKKLHEEWLEKLLKTNTWFEVP
jgi:hypothetical protein